MTETPFTAAMFTPTKFDTAADKAKFANHLVRFVHSDFNRNLFPKWFYNRLSMTFGHIAHFNINGFYGVHFASDGARLDWLRLVANAPAFGDPAYTYSDVERALAAWVKDSGLIPGYVERIAAARETAERAELARLKAKYEPTS